MDKEELQKNIALYYSKLPPEAQQMFSEMKWLEELKKLSIKYALNEEQSQTLGTETTLVLLGLIPILEYEQNLLNEIKISKELVQSMIADVKNTILKPVAPQITEAYSKNTEPATSEEAEIESELSTRFEKLSPDIREAVIQANYYNVLYQIAQSYKLNVIQIGTLEEITTGIITGAVKADKFEEVLKGKLNLESQKVRNIVSDVNEKILKVIREKMMGETGAVEKEESVLPISPEETKIQKHEEEVLNKAGITINEPAKQDLVPEIVKSPSMLEQKFLNSFQLPSTKSEHSLPGVSKEPGAAAEVGKKYPSKDPYRELPE